MVFTSRNLDWWCERGILLLALAALVLAPLAFGAVYVWTFLALEGLVLGMAALWLVRLWGGHKPKLLWPPLAWAVVAFVLYAVARYFTADVEYAARQELIRVLLFAVLFLVVASNLYDQDSTEAVVYTLTAVAAAASSYAVFQFCRHSLHVWNLTSPYTGRASGTYINPDHFAGFLELVLPLPLAFLLAGRVGVTTRVVLAYAVVVILTGLAMTVSRGGWVAGALGILLLLGFLMGHRNHRLRAVVVLLVLLAGGGIFIQQMLSKSVEFRRRVVKTEDQAPDVLDWRARLTPWTAAVKIWEEHPWWGAGPGHYDIRFREYRAEGYQRRPEHAHNDYLELLADWGVAGAAIVFAGMGVFVAGLRRTWPHVRREENAFGTGMSNRYAFFLGAVAGLFALAAHSLVDFNLHVPANALVGVTLLAMLSGNLRFSSKRYWVRARLPLQLGLSVVIVGLIAYLAGQAWRAGSAELWAKRAEHLPNFSAEQAAALGKSMACDPNNLTAYNIGECFRVQSWEGGENYMELAEEALPYYAEGMRLNPYDPNCPLREGMCLDWLGRHGEAGKYFKLAESLDPNGNFVVANIGWHYVQVGDYSAAKQWFVRANNLAVGENLIARNYLEICESKLRERASGQLPVQMFYPRKEN